MVVSGKKRNEISLRYAQGEVFNSDKQIYFGTGEYQNTSLTAQNEPLHFRDQSVEVAIPPLGAIVLKFF